MKYKPTPNRDRPSVRIWQWAMLTSIAVAFGTSIFSAAAQTPAPTNPPTTMRASDADRQMMDNSLPSTPEPPARGPEPKVPGRPPIILDREGSFTAGGVVIGDPNTKSLSCDHGFVEYQIPVHPRAVNLWMWHSSSVQVWQNRWDGGEGFQSIFLRQGYPVYLWDGPRVGRGNWSCAQIIYKPVLRDQGNFTAWRLGKTYPNWFPGVQFPTKDPEAWRQATSARYDEFDTNNNAMLEADAAAKAIDRIGPTVLLTNSAGGFRGLLAALKTDNIKGIVCYENVGFIYPEGVGPADRPAPFGPMHVSLAEFKKLTKFPIQLVFGDNTDKFPQWTSTLAMAKQFVAAVNANGGHAEILMLPDAGLKGNTHLPFADMNNVAVADLLKQFLKKNGLDGQAVGQ